MAASVIRPWGTSPRNLDASFTAELFGHLHRADQRRWARGYLEGLLWTPGKKTVRRLAASVFDSPTASQSLQQFINSSPWQWGPARAGLTRWTERRLRPRAWTLGVAVLPKRGDRSVGVHRRFDPGPGRIVNCQLGLGLFLSGGRQSIPVDWRLFLPPQWAEDAERREGTRIPRSVRHEPLWLQAAELVDTLASRTSLGAAPVVADPVGFLNPAELLAALDAQERDFVIGVPVDFPAMGGGRFAGYGRCRPNAVADVQQLLGIGRSLDPQPVTVAGPDGSRRQLYVRSALVRLPHEAGRSWASQPTYRVVAAREPGAPWPGRVWISNLAHRRVDELLTLAQLTEGTDRVIRTLGADFGLHDFEGRSFPGWHHHMTMVSAAYAHHRLGHVAESVDRLRPAPPTPRIA